jgi:hypothetical protein
MVYTAVLDLSVGWVGVVLEVGRRIGSQWAMALMDQASCIKQYHRPVFSRWGLETVANGPLNALQISIHAEHRSHSLVLISKKLNCCRVALFSLKLENGTVHLTEVLRYLRQMEGLSWSMGC